MFLKLYLQTTDYYGRISWCLGSLGLKCLHFWHNFLFSIFWLMHTKKWYQLSENPVLIWTSPAALRLFRSWKKCTNGKKKKKCCFRLEDYFSLSLFFLEQSLFFLLCSPPSQPRVEHEESSIVSLLKQAAAMAAREGGKGMRGGGLCVHSSAPATPPPPLRICDPSFTFPSQRSRSPLPSCL